MAMLLPAALTAVGVSASTAATIGTIASVGLTAASAFSSIQAGNAESANLKVQARQADLNARTDALRGKQEAAAISDQLNRDLASQNALFGARGLVQSEGSAQAAQEVSRLNASRDIDLARFDAETAAANSKQQSANLKSDAKAAKKSGFLQAVNTISGFKSYGGAKGGTGGATNIPIPKRKPSLLAGI